MYLGLAIRMAVDLGLQKIVGVKYQGERDPWYTRTWSHKGSDEDDDHDHHKQSEHDSYGMEEQDILEQERTDTFWAVFVLDRVISSGTGRPVTFRDDDFELSLPQPALDPASGWPAPFPAFIQIIHLYGRVSDVLNNIRNADDLTEEKIARLAQMESDLTQIYQKQPERLHFNAHNFQSYVRANQGTTFILLHFWFHALIIVLHQPTLLTPFGSLSRTQLLPNSRELSMSSAKTIADILAFAELIDPKSFIGNPFTSQPMYIAACAFLTESVVNASSPPSREASPLVDARRERPGTNGRPMTTSHEAKSAKHSLLASAANQNYQRCYKSLQQLQQYWGGVGYILTALDQKSKGIWDCETFTFEEYESIRLARRSSLSRLARMENAASPNAPPIAWSLTGTTNSPNSNLTLLYQNNASASSAAANGGLAPPPPPIPVSAPTPPGNMIYDPIRQSIPETQSMFPPAYPQPNMSAVRYQAHPSQRPSGSKSAKYERMASDELDPHSPETNDSRQHGSMGHGLSHPPTSYTTPSSQHSSSYEVSGNHSGSPSSSLTDASGMGGHQQQQHSHHHHGHQQHGHHHNHHHGHSGGGVSQTVSPGSHGQYQGDYMASGGDGLPAGPYLYPISEVINFDSFDGLGLPNEMMPPWLEVLPSDVFGFLEGGMGESHEEQ